MDDQHKGPGDGVQEGLSPRSARAVGIFTLRIRELFSACPEDIAREAALRWSRTCSPKVQEREARVTHDETVRNALIEHVRWTLTDWPALVAAGRTDPLNRKRVSVRVREIVESWKPTGAVS
jgi:hypothetical protein